MLIFRMMQITREPVSLSVKPVQPSQCFVCFIFLPEDVPRANPKHTILVFIKRSHIVATDRSAIGGIKAIVDELVRTFVKTVESFIGCNPYCTCMVCEHGCNGVAGQAVGILFIVAKVF